MIPACRLKSLTSVFTVIVALAFCAPAHAFSAASPDDDDNAPPRLLAMVDLNRDGIADIAEIQPPADRSGAAVLAISLGRGDGTFNHAVTYPVLGHAPRSIVSGDFNGDGAPDLIIGDDDGALVLLLGDGTGKVTPFGEVAHLDSVVSIAVADFNHDGVPDLAVSDWRASEVAVFMGGSKGTFRRASSYPLRMPGTVAHVAAADFNGDGVPDLAVTYADDDGYMYEVMLGNGN